jgi:dihydrofolate synthase/folylpolyglutamate synthase
MTRTAADIFYSFARVIDLSLERMQAALALLGNPQDRLPPVVHVAGTNGKGSTIAFVRAMAEAAGQRVHVYTSPHLVRIEERYRLAGRLIAPDHLQRLALQVEAVARQVPLTVFEAETAAGFLAFAEVRADLLLLEVGLGGRLDATNVVQRPRLTAITPVDYDHKEFLGETIALIAGEKAGIIKPGVPVVVSAQRPEALEVIEARADALGAPLRVFGRDFDGWPERGRFVLQTSDRLLDLPEPALAGAHQSLNAATACQIALELGLPDEAIAAGLTRAAWPARMQRLTRGPYAEPVLAAGGELWLDGGHNPQGAEAAARHMLALQARDPRPFALVCGLLANKDHDGFFRAFTGLAPQAVVTAPIRSSPSGTAPEALAQLARTHGLPASPAPTPLDAVAAAVAAAGPRARILICGSLYLAGDVLADGNQPQ